MLSTKQQSFNWPRVTKSRRRPHRHRSLQKHVSHRSRIDISYKAENTYEIICFQHDQSSKLDTQHIRVIGLRIRPSSRISPLNNDQVLTFVDTIFIYHSYLLQIPSATTTDHHSSSMKRFNKQSTMAAGSSFVTKVCQRPQLRSMVKRNKVYSTTFQYTLITSQLRTQISKIDKSWIIANR